MRSPAPRANADRAEVSTRNGFPHTIAGAMPEGDFAALYLRRRFGLSPCLAQTVAILAGLGRALS
jgi:hypothetical protein